MKLNRTTAITLLGLVLLALLVWGFWPGPVLVESAVAVRAPLSVTVEEEGHTRVKDRFVISAPVAGYLQRSALEVGDAVSQGQTLALMEPLRPEVLDPRSRARAEAQVAAAHAAIKGAEQQVTAARAEAGFARSDQKRKQERQGGALVSQGELEQAATMGCTLVKFFPCEPLGGVAWLQAMSGPYLQTGVRIVPMGGIRTENLTDYTNLPIVAAAGGSWMAAADLIRNENWDEVTALTKAALALITAI